MEHKEIDTIQCGMYVKKCVNCKVITQIFFNYKWRRAQTCLGSKLIIECTEGEPETVNDFMRLVYESHNKKIYKKYEHKFNAYQKKYLQQFI